MVVAKFFDDGDPPFMGRQKCICCGAEIRLKLPTFDFELKRVGGRRSRCRCFRGWIGWSGNFSG
jgi:hypothetical protein